MSAVRKARKRALQPQLRLVYAHDGPRYEQIDGTTGYRYGSVDVRRRLGPAIAPAGSGDWHDQFDRAALRRIAQENDRDSLIYNALVTRAVDFWIGDGLKLVPNTGNARTNARIVELWNEWSEDPEQRGLFDWHDIEVMAARALVNDGDVAAVLPDEDSQFAFVESERIQNPSGKPSKTGAKGPRIYDGVELDARGRPGAYYIGGFGEEGAAKIERYPAANVAFLAHTLRHSQTRGMTPMAPVFPMLERVTDVANSEAAAWQMLSRFAISINRSNAAAIAQATSVARDDAAEGDLASRYHDIGWATIFHGEVGEELKAIDRNLPGANFSESLRIYLRLSGLILALPLELMLLDFSQGSYSSVRGALTVAFRTFTRWQRLIRRGWHMPVYRWRVGQWIRAAKLPDRPETYQHGWLAPRFPYLDPAKDSEAVGNMVDRGLITYGDALAEQNRSLETQTARRAEEIEAAIATADELNQRHARKIAAGTMKPVDWRLFAGLLEPKPETAKSGAPPNEPAAGDPPRMRKR